MTDSLGEGLGRLTTGGLFRLRYGAYGHLLGRRDAPPGSATAALLHRLAAWDAGAVLLCVRKLLEERDEVGEVLAGRPRGDGPPPRDALVGEVGQMLYWATVLAVGCGVPPDAAGPGDVERGRAGEWPAKADIDRDGDAAAILRRVFLEAGRALAAFAGAHPDVPPVEARELALADLRQMAARPYLADYLRGQVAAGEGPGL